MSERVLVREEDIAAIEEAGYAFYRRKENDLAVRMLALALRFRAESGLGTPAVYGQENVVDFVARRAQR